MKLKRRARRKQRAVHAVTDVTGFGLLGHAREMAIGSGVSMKIDHARMEYLPGAIEAARSGFFSGGMANNRDFVEGCVAFAPSVPDEFRALLFDPQTSGGLLAAIAPESADAALAALQAPQVSARIVGEVIAKRSPLLEISDLRESCTLLLFPILHGPDNSRNHRRAARQRIFFGALRACRDFCRDAGRGVSRCRHRGRKFFPAIRWPS